MEIQAPHAKAMEIKKKRRNYKKNPRERKINLRKGIYKTLKKVAPNQEISAKAMEVMNDLLMDAMRRICDTARGLMNLPGANKTMDSRTIQCAVKLTVPGELLKHSMCEGHKAIVRYLSASV